MTAPTSGEAIPIRDRAASPDWSATSSGSSEPAKIPGPYVLVGTSGGGYITAGYAYIHPRRVAGMVFVEVPAPFRDPPREIVEATDPDNPANVESATTCRSKGRVERPQADRGHPRDDHHRQALRRDDQGVAVSRPSGERCGATSPTRGLARPQPTREADRGHTGHAVEEEDPD